MSNCINSGISKIYVLTQFNSTSLNRHLARTYNFGSCMHGCPARLLCPSHNRPACRLGPSMSAAKATATIACSCPGVHACARLWSLGHRRDVYRCWQPRRRPRTRSGSRAPQTLCGNTPGCSRTSRTGLCRTWSSCPATTCASPTSCCRPGCEQARRWHVAAAESSAEAEQWELCWAIHVLQHADPARLALNAGLHRAAGSHSRSRSRARSLPQVIGSLVARTFHACGTKQQAMCRYRMDYMKFVEHHRATGADITIGCLPCDEERASDFGLMKIDDDGRITVRPCAPLARMRGCCGVQVQVLWHAQCIA